MEENDEPDRIEYKNRRKGQKSKRVQNRTNKQKKKHIKLKNHILEWKTSSKERRKLAN